MGTCLGAHHGLTVVGLTTASAYLSPQGLQLSALVPGYLSHKCRLVEGRHNVVLLLTNCGSETTKPGFKQYLTRVGFSRSPELWTR